MVETHVAEVAAIRRDPTLNKQERQERVHASYVAMSQELSPYLTLAQAQRLQLAISQLESPKKPFAGLPFTPSISLKYGTYILSGSTARSIFGDSPARLSIGFLGGAEKVGRRTELSFSVDTLSLSGATNKFAMVSPQVAYGIYNPIGKLTLVYAKVFAGPSYVDYSFDMPSGTHVGAKRLGADGGIELGLKYGPVKLTASYRLLTEAAGVNLSGLQLGVSWNVLRF